MPRQKRVPELTDEDWRIWFDSPDGSMACPADGCGRVSAAYWDGVNEVLKWAGCKHRAFVPESPLLWPPPESHVQRGQ
jgi:hypothetical protein